VKEQKKKTTNDSEFVSYDKQHTTNKQGKHRGNGADPSAGSEQKPGLEAGHAAPSHGSRVVAGKNAEPLNRTVGDAPRHSGRDLPETSVVGTRKAS
jgi:hypothetical protein